MPSRYKPIKSQRFFTRNRMYDAIDWNDWDEVVRRWKQQMHWWYVSPLRNLRRRSVHNGFPVVALGCILLDALSQYAEGLDYSKGAAFKRFVRANLPTASTQIPTPIRSWVESHNNQTVLRDYADVLWSGFRCGILHEAHVPLYGGLASGSAIFEIHSPAAARYADTGGDCPVIIVDPGKFADAVVQAFRDFVSALLAAGPSSQVRSNFCRKFKASYGIDIGHEP